MERLDRLSAYFNERDRKRLEAKTKESNGVPEMSADEIRLSCLQNNGYETAELNDKLYLHFRGFRRIENLENYTGCRSIWLDSNGFDKIENLETMTELRCLYLSKNLIRHIEGLTSLANLTILDLSYNRLTQLENLSCCPSLQTLNVANNSIAGIDSIKHLQDCQALTNVDLTNNRLENNEEFLAVFPLVPKLVTLSVNGNDITKIASFRKKMIAATPKLTYLDRPVEEQERLFAEAFVSGGNEAEMKARNDWKEAQNQKRIAEMQEFRAWQKEQQRLRDQARAEGRSLIKEFTAEEQEERRKEAEKAAAAEKEMIANGIDKLAGKYWQMEGRPENRGKDVLEMAAEQVKAEKERKEKKEQEVEETEEEEEEVKDERIAIEEIDVDIDLTDATSEKEKSRSAKSSAANSPVKSSVASPVRDGLTAATAISSFPDKSTKIVITEEDDDEDDQEGDSDDEARDTDENEEEKPLVVASVVLQPPKAPTEEEVRAKEIAEEEKRQERERQLQEQRELYERQQRVADSFEIYKRQYEARKNQPSSASTGSHMHHSTWAAASLSSTNATALTISSNTAATATSGPSARAEENKKIVRSFQTTPDEDDEDEPLYWSEVMDLELAKQVKANVFDFQKISDCMTEAARWRRLDNHFVHENPAVLTKDVCRLRWAELDANNWSVPAPGITAKDTVFRINLTDDILQQTGGAQPSYEALSSLSRGNRPNYLKVPTAFPSVQDINDELD